MSRLLIQFGFLKNLRTFIAVLNGLLLSVILVNNFSSDIASEWFFIANIAALFVISDLSLSTSIARINSTAISSGDIDEANDYVANSVALLTVFTIVISLVCYLAYNNIKADVNYLKELVIFVLMISVLQVPLKICDGILISKLYLNRQIACDLIGGVIKLSALIYYHLSLDQNIQFLGFIYFGASLLVSILKLIASEQSRHIYLNLKVQKIRYLIEFSLASLIMSSSNALTRQIFLIVAYYLVSAKDYVFINLVYLFYFNMYQVQTTFLSAIGPIIVNAKAKFENIGVTESTSRFLRYTRIICIGVFVLLITIFYPLVTFIYRNDEINFLFITVLMVSGNVLFYFTYSDLIYRSALNYLSLHWFVSRAEFFINSAALILAVIMLSSSQIDVSLIAGVCLLSPLIFRSLAGYRAKFDEVLGKV